MGELMVLLVLREVVKGWRGRRVNGRIDVGCAVHTYITSYAVRDLAACY